MLWVGLGRMLMLLLFCSLYLYTYKLTLGSSVWGLCVV